MIKKMKCPKCKKELKKIGVESKAYQSYNVKDKQYDNLEIGKTTGYFCWECGEYLPDNFVEKNWSEL